MITGPVSGKTGLSSLKRGVKRVELDNHIPRVGDLPYWSSPPMQFSFTEVATLTLGEYPFEAERTVMTNTKNLNNSTLIYFYDMSFSADIPLLDYQNALQLASGDNEIPQFSMFMQSDRNAPVLQDPILCQDYFNGQDYQLLIEPKQTPNKLNAFFRGKLKQTAALAGISKINLTFTFYAQQITDDNFIQSFKQGYPRPTLGSN